MNLVGRNALLGSGQEKQRRQPFGERNFGALKHGFNGHCELFATLGALVQAGAVSLTLEARKLVLIGIAAMRADRPVRPTPSLKPLAGFGFVGEDRVLEVGHCLYSLGSG